MLFFASSPQDFVFESVHYFRLVAVQNHWRWQLKFRFFGLINIQVHKLPAMCLRVFLQMLTVAQLVIEFPALLYLLQPIIGLCLQPVHALASCFFSLLNFRCPSMSRSRKWYFYLKFSLKNCACIVRLPSLRSARLRQFLINE